MEFRERSAMGPAMRAARLAGRERLRSEPPLGIATLFVLYALVFFVLIESHPFGERTFLAVSDVLGLVPPFVAGGLALFAGWRSAGHARRGWQLIGAGCLAWAAGEVAWTVYEVVLRQDPFPSVADVGYLAMLPLVAVGLIVLTSEDRRLAHARPTLDGIAVVLAATALVWYFVLHPTYTESAASVFEKVIGGAYPVGDLVVAYALAVAAQRRWDAPQESVVLVTLLAGMLVLIAADVGFAYLTLHDRYTSTSFVNLGWPYGFLLIGYAAALGTNRTLADDIGARVTEPREWGLPLALLPLTFLLLIAALRENSAAISVPLLVMAGIAVLAILARLAINFGLMREVRASRERLIAWFQEHRRSAL